MTTAEQRRHASRRVAALSGPLNAWPPDVPVYVMLPNGRCTVALTIEEAADKIADVPGATPARHPNLDRPLIGRTP